MDYNLCPQPIFQVHLKGYASRGGAREFYLILKRLRILNFLHLQRHSHSDFPFLLF